MSDLPISSRLETYPYLPPSDNIAKLQQLLTEDFSFVFLLERRIVARCISRHLSRLSVTYRHIGRYIGLVYVGKVSRRIEPRTRVGCSSLLVDSRSIVIRYFADGSPTLGRFNGQYLG